VTPPLSTAAPSGRRIPAAYYRGGTSKGVFFRTEDLPADPAARDRILLRIIGSPDPYGKHIDGLGGATSSTSKVVLVRRTERPDCDVEYLFGAVAIEEPLIDWSGNCGNLTAAVAPFAITEGLFAAPPEGLATVRLWQGNLGKRIIAQVPMRAGEVLETGDFQLDGVAFPSAEIQLEFLDPGGSDQESASGPLFPTGRSSDTLDVPGFGALEATLINAGNPTIFVRASVLGLRGNEAKASMDGDSALLAQCEAIRAHGAVVMGLSASAADATLHRPHTPKLALIAPPLDYVTVTGRTIGRQEMDLQVRILSMGKQHHAITGTGAIATAVAAAIPDTLVARCQTGAADALRIAQPSGITRCGACAEWNGHEWIVTRALMSRSARRLMEGWVRVNL